MKKIDSKIFSYLFSALPTIHNHHTPEDPVHKLLKETARIEATRLFSSESITSVNFGPFGAIKFPFHKMGATSSINLFDLDELIIFTYYWLHRSHYHKVADIGANIGLHTLILSKCGYHVRSFEPDPEHVKFIKKHIKINQCEKVEVFQNAVSSQDGEMDFIRVLGNTTGSHLAGAKDNPYGKLETLKVETKSILPIMEWADLVKMDVEGHEGKIIPTIPTKLWEKTDMLVEIGSLQNAKIVFESLQKQKINLFAQKINWNKVTSIKDMPSSYKEGTLFVTAKKDIHWDNK